MKFYFGMLYRFGSYLTGLYAGLVLCAGAGCDSGSEEVSVEYNHYRFDNNVIAKLPVYDSLVTAILQRFSFFRQYIRDKDSYRSFRYIPLSTDVDVFKRLPPEIAAAIDPYFNRLGYDFIYGFDVFKDSSIKINIRNNESKRDEINIGESLSWYPAGSTIKRRQFPVKDTILDKHWQYWTGFYKRSPF